MKAICSAHRNVGQRIDSLGSGGQSQRSWIEPDSQVGASLYSSSRPAYLANMYRAIAASLAGGISHDRIGQVRAGHVERRQDHQHEHSDDQGEFDKGLRAAWHSASYKGTRQVREPAQVLILFAITAMSILTVVGLLYSFGFVLAQRRSLQTAADASSLSGAWQVLRELASDNRSDATVLSVIVQFATTNGVPSDGTAANASYISAVYLDSSGVSLVPVGGGGRFPVSARGVLVKVKSQVPTFLPSFLQVWQVLVQDNASAIAKPSASVVAAVAVAPVAVLQADARAAYAGQVAYDLFTHQVAGGLPPTLDLAASGAPSFGPATTNQQYWSDGQHTATWQLSQPGNVNLAGNPYYDSIALGLRDNVRRQALVDASGAAYALLTLPVYDTSTATSVHIVSFVQFKLLAADISATSARGMIVPYAAAAWGTALAPSIDLGAAVVALTP